MYRTRSSTSSLKLAFGFWLLAFSLSACGFKPVYGKETEQGPQLAAIRVADIPGRNGQVLRTTLEDLLNPENVYSEPQYQLNIKLERALRELGIQDNLRVTRYDVALTAKYSLISLVDGREVTNGVSRIKSSYNRTESEFATFVADEDANQKAAEEMARDIKSRLAVFLSR